MVRRGSTVMILTPRAFAAKTMFHQPMGLLQQFVAQIIKTLVFAVGAAPMFSTPKLSVSPTRQPERQAADDSVHQVVEPK